MMRNSVRQIGICVCVNLSLLSYIDIKVLCHKLGDIYGYCHCIFHLCLRLNFGIVFRIETLQEYR